MQPSSPASSSWKHALERLEMLLAGETPTASALEGLAPPRELGMLMLLLSARLVREGPGSRAAIGRKPARLLNLAAEAARAGLVPLRVPMEIRTNLCRAEDLVRGAGAWKTEAAMWWAPLPAASRQERIWEELARGGAASLSSSLEARFRRAFTRDGNPNPWVHQEIMLSSALIAAIHGEIETALAEGALAFQIAGVGASGERSVKRADRVCYLSGFEPQLLRAAPHLAALVQWSVLRLSQWVGDVWPRMGLTAPQRAMLACYPAPSFGYDGHLDNPGGEDDNGRALSLVLYLNDPKNPCRGGELALWRAGAGPGEEAAAVLAPRPGSAVWFDSRAVAHRVMPIGEGPARRALSLWFQDRPGMPRAAMASLPSLSLTDVLAGVPAPPLPDERLLFHELRDDAENGVLHVSSRGSKRPRVGLVSTVYRAGKSLEQWCAHHFALGFDHIVLVFDHLDDPAEAEDAQRLRRRFGERQLSIWSGSELRMEAWPMLTRSETVRKLLPFARFGGSSSAVAARQTLNATVALQAAVGKRLGGAPLDWLLHLDADEYFYLEGAHRGGGDLHQHFAHAGQLGWSRLRYVNHEWMAPGDREEGPCFKCNPRLAIARLGGAGWSALTRHLKMAQNDRRPWFTGYHNGKAAVAVKRAAAAAGVHDWYLAEPVSPRESGFLAGPCVLHVHLASAAAFCRKYLSKAADPMSEKSGLFPPSPVEVAAMGLIRQSRREAWDRSELEKRLHALYHDLISFSPQERSLLEEAGLLMRPELCTSLTDKAGK